MNKSKYLKKDENIEDLEFFKNMNLNFKEFLEEKDKINMNLQNTIFYNKEETKLDKPKLVFSDYEIKAMLSPENTIDINQNTLSNLITYLETLSQKIQYNLTGSNSPKIIIDNLDTFTDLKIIKQGITKDLRSDRELSIIEIDLEAFKVYEDLYQTYIKGPEAFTNLFKAYWELIYGSKVVVLLKNGYIKDAPEQLDPTSDDLRENILGTKKRLRTLKGIVKRVSDVESTVLKDRCYCSSCQGYFDFYYEHKPDKLKAPGCSNENCNASEKKTSIIKSFRVLEYHQILELDSEYDNEGGVLTKSFKIKITDRRLFNKIQLGARIKVKATENIEFKNSNSGFIVFQVYCVQKIKGDEFETTVAITEEEQKEIKKFAQSKDLWETLRNTIYPKLTGLENLKNACLLQQFSTFDRSPTKGKEKLQSYTKDDINILLIGAAGTGKSALLRASHQFFGGTHTIGLGSTAAGLTASAGKNSDGIWSVDAGALLLANNKTLYFDELDKVNSNTILNSLLEAMEQQTVSISKAGITRTYPAKTKILAAANPKYRAQFDKDAIPIKQIGLPKVLLSRFDLILIVDQTLDPLRDLQILKMNNDPQKYIIEESKKTLIRNYIRKSREIVNVSIEDKLEKEIVEFYAHICRTLKKLGLEEDYELVGPRQLNSIIRLVKAKARSRLSNKVSSSDLEFVKNLYKDSLKNLYNTSLDQEESYKENPLTLDFVKFTYTKKVKDDMAKVKQTIYMCPNLDKKSLWLEVSQKYNNFNYADFSKAITLLEQEFQIYKPNGLHKYRVRQE